MTNDVACSNCAGHLETGWNSCPHCGLNFNCPGCREQVRSDWVKCPHCSYELDQPVLEGRENELQAQDIVFRLKERRDDLELETETFYEKIANRTKAGKWAFWLLFGQMFTVIHFLIAQAYNVNIFADFSWALGLMIGIVFILVQKGTENLRSAIFVMADISDEPYDEFVSWFSKFLRRRLSARVAVRYGVFFGLANIVLGQLYGVWYDDLALIISINIQWFIVGFGGGIAVSGGVAIIQQTLEFGNRNLIFNGSSKDGCGGTSEIGKKILVDSLFFFIFGISIAAYILLSPWTNEDEWYVKLAIYFWMIWPYICALVVFIVPAFTIHKQLRNFKLTRISILRSKRRALQKRLHARKSRQGVTSIGAQRYLVDEVSSADHEISDLLNMSTWPYNLRSLAQFTFSLLIPFVLWLLER